jgi:hypothetical protein
MFVDSSHHLGSFLVGWSAKKKLSSSPGRRGLGVAKSRYHNQISDLAWPRSDRRAIRQDENTFA